VIAARPDARGGVAAGRDFDGDCYADLIVVDTTARNLTVLRMGPDAGSPTELDFSAASLPDDLAREIGDVDNDWSPDSCDVDFDNDGVIGGADLSLFRRCVGNPAVGRCEAVDIDGDGTVGPRALSLIVLGLGDPACK